MVVPEKMGVYLYGPMLEQHGVVSARGSEFARRFSKQFGYSIMDFLFQGRGEESEEGQ